jgi:hypothetical protein
MDACIYQYRSYFRIGIIAFFLMIGAMLLPLRAGAEIREAIPSLPSAVPSAEVAWYYWGPRFRHHRFFYRPYYHFRPYFYYYNPYRRW